MSFEFRLDSIDGVEHLTLKGRLDGATYLALEKTINQLFTATGERVLMDFSDLVYISSAGLRLILVAAKRARQSEGRLILCGMSPMVREVFDISGFLKIMETADHRADAVRALQA